MAFMVVIAGLFSLASQIPFSVNLGYCLAIGLSTHALSFLICWWRSTAIDWKTALLAIPLGTSIGLIIGSLLQGKNPLWLADNPDVVRISLVISLILGTAFSYYFYSRGIIAEANARQQQDSIDRAAHAREMAEAHLRLLQAQIEPHFLFNTLANVLGLIHDDPGKAERMLEDFIGYLRGSLKRSREGSSTLGEELELVRAYLDIQVIRMGGRLDVSIEVDDDLRELRLPPFLIQPLVENAIRHGLEPKADGGTLTIEVRQNDTALVVEVADTGFGLSPDFRPGVGLSSVRDRLDALYPQQADFTLTENSPHGVVVRFQIPLTALRP
jgi:sensor histidine kinase YesM